MAINFPGSPSVSDTHTHNGRTWEWDGTSWNSVDSGTPTLIDISANNTTNANFYVTFVDGATGDQILETDTNLTYNPSTNVLQTTANQAKYADLAEMYLADQAYPIGTVLMIGGEHEVTLAVKDTHKTVGVVSDKPAYLMNSDLSGEYPTPVAYIGRVPCRVVGTISKGDCLVTSDIPGVATVKLPTEISTGQLIGKALEDYDRLEPGTIEIMVGRI